MAKDIIKMSMGEFDRLKIIQKVITKEITQIKAAEVIGLSDRQVRRIVKRVQKEGANGITHRNRGRRSERKMMEEDEERITQIVEEKYADFGPTLASEKLRERHGIKVGREKLRQIMIAKGTWRVRRRRKKGHQWRERKSYFGEMVQMDGSHHDWLEERGPRMALMGYADDATSRVYGRFYDYEGVYPAMDSLAHYIRGYGRPVSLYLDKHSTYKTTREPSLDELLSGERAATQFGRACKELGIKVIHAHSPQAKGRIERTFATLQDRLVKEMRLEDISTLEQANAFLNNYLDQYNKHFAKQPLKKGNLHRRLPAGIKLRDILCIKGQRTINNGYIVKWVGKKLLIENPNIAMRRAKVEVREHFDGEIRIRFKGRFLKLKEISQHQAERKKKETRTNRMPEKKKGKYIPPPDHPWRRHNPKLHHNCYLERI